MERVLCVCETHYQLIIAFRLRLSVHKDDMFDIVLTDYFNNMYSLRKQLIALNIFDNVYALPRRKYQKNIVNQGIMFLFGRYQIANDIPKHYTILIFARFSQLTMALYARQKVLSVKIIEDSPLYYIYDYIKWPFTTTEPIRIALNNLFCFRIGLNLSRFFKNHFDMYVYVPKLVNCDIVPFRPVPIPTLAENEADFKNIVDTLYNGISESILDRQFVFFEQPFSNDGYPSDEAFVLNLAQIVGIDNFSIKLHPRSTDDRFSKYGIAVWKNQNSPFEIYCLNDDFKGKVLLTIFSTSVISAHLNFGCKAKIILLYKVIGIYPILYNKGVFEDLIGKIIENYDKEKKWIYIPENIDELIKILKVL